MARIPAGGEKPRPQPYRHTDLGPRRHASHCNPRHRLLILCVHQYITAANIPVPCSVALPMFRSPWSVPYAQLVTRISVFCDILSFTYGYWETLSMMYVIESSIWTFLRVLNSFLPEIVLRSSHSGRLIKLKVSFFIDHNMCSGCRWSRELQYLMLSALKLTHRLKCSKDKCSDMMHNPIHPANWSWLDSCHFY